MKKIHLNIQKLCLAALMTTCLIGCGGDGGDSTRFEVRIHNIGADAITTSNGETIPSVFSPGVATVYYPEAFTLFTPGQSASVGLEQLAEDGQIDNLAEEAANVEAVEEVVTFAMPLDSDGPGPLLPSNSYIFEIEANAGQHLELATMFVQSNDLFIASSGGGIALFDENGDARSGNVTQEFTYWDAGTEVNEEPGVGQNQAPRQDGANTGMDEDGVVRRLNENDFAVPDVSNVVEITITPIN